MVERVKLQTNQPGIGARGNVRFDDSAGRNAARVTAQVHRLNSHLNNMQDDATVRKATNAGMTAGAAQDFKILNEDTIAARAFNKAARTTYQAALETDTRRKFDELFEQHRNDPAALKSALTGYKAGKMKEIKDVDQNMLPLYEEIFDRHSRPLIKASHKEALDVQRQEETAGVMSAVEQNIKGVERLANIEESDANFELAYADERELMVAKLTDIGPPQAFKFEGVEYPADPTRSGAIDVDDIQLLVDDVDDRVTISRTMGKFDRAPDKLAFMENFKASTNDSLSMEQRERVMSKMRTEISRAKTEYNARRALIKDSVTDAIYVMDRGFTPPGYDALLQTVGEFPELQKSLLIANQQKELAGEFSKATPIEQRDMINKVQSDIDEGGTVDRANVELLERYNRIHDDTMQGLKTDPVSYANSVGLVDVEPIDPQRPETLAARSKVSDIIREKYGISTHGLTEAEVGALENRIEYVDSAEKMTIFSSYRMQMNDDQFGALMFELAPKQPIYTFAASITPEAPKLSHELTRAARLIEDPEMKKFLPVKADYLTIVNDYFGDSFKHNPVAMSQIMQSGLAVDLLRRQHTGTLDSFDDGALEDIFEELTGGVYKYNGQKILAPRRGFTQESFSNFMDKLQLTDLDIEGTRPFMGNGDAVTPDMIRNYGHLESVGQGEYLVKVNGFYVNDGSGEPYILDVENIMQRRGQ